MLLPHFSTLPTLATTITLLSSAASSILSSRKLIIFRFVSLCIPLRQQAEPEFPDQVLRFPDELQLANETVRRHQRQTGSPPAPVS